MGHYKYNWIKLMADIPTRLVQLRRELNLTQQEMADRMGIHVNQVRRYESGKAKPSLEVLEKIALTLHVSLDWLVFGEDVRGPDDELKLQFEALRHFDEEDRKIAKALLESLILKHNAKRAFAK
jgi:transcriptional regulator with XRE-family HTH domain